MFNIKPPDNAILTPLRNEIDSKTKPTGSLGQLEDIAAKIGWIQQTLKPALKKPVILVFASDHGIAADGIVNPYPQEVTWQMVYNFLNGGAAINLFAGQHDIMINVIDAGVNYDFTDHPNLIQAKIAKGTKNYLHEPAMTMAQCSEAMQKGASLVRLMHSVGSNIIGFGEMGIGNTSSASLLMSVLTRMPLEECVGSGTGLDKKGIAKKCEVLRQALEKHGISDSPVENLSIYGGFEIAMICGGMLQAAELGMVIMVDGFITTVALLAACKLAPAVIDYCLFSHVSEEKGHRALLEYIHVKPILNLNMRLGEGTGAAIAYPVIKSAVTFVNEMATFESAKVSDIPNKNQ